MNKNRVTILEASQIMGVSQQFIRISLQRGVLPIGTAVQISGNRYTYFISRKQLNEYVLMRGGESDEESKG